MSKRTIAIAGFGLVLAIGIPLYYVVIKHRASSSLDDLIGERFQTPRACPVTEVTVPQGGRVTCQTAYEDAQDASTWLVLGSWDRGTIRVPQGIASVDNKVAGVFKRGGDETWATHMRAQADVIFASAVAGGALAIWKGLPSRESVLSHLEAAH